jgi:hypothetical protein
MVNSVVCEAAGSLAQYAFHVRVVTKRSLNRALTRGVESQMELARGARAPPMTVIQL